MTEDEELVAALKKDWGTADLGITDRMMLGYVDKLTRDPPSIKREDLDALHAVGFDDVAVLQINLIASFFAYINRVADGLGVGRA